MSACILLQSQPIQARFNSGKVSGPVIGIDLGTTNSCVALMEGKVSPTWFQSIFQPGWQHAFTRLVALNPLRPGPLTSTSLCSGPTSA